MKNVAGDAPSAFVGVTDSVARMPLVGSIRFVVLSYRKVAGMPARL